MEQVVISSANECSPLGLPFSLCSCFRATLYAPRVSGQENGIIPNQITTCAEHLKHSRSFLFRSRRAVISRRERRTGEKTQSDRKVYCRSISKRSFLKRRVVSEIFIRYTKRNLVLKSKRKTCVSSYGRFTCCTNTETSVSSIFVGFFNLFTANRSNTVTDIMTTLW